MVIAVILVQRQGWVYTGTLMKHMSPTVCVWSSLTHWHIITTLISTAGIRGWWHWTFLMMYALAHSHMPVSLLPLRMFPLWFIDFLAAVNLPMSWVKAPRQLHMCYQKQMLGICGRDKAILQMGMVFCLLRHSCPLNMQIQTFICIIYILPVKRNQSIFKRGRCSKDV